MRRVLLTITMLLLATCGRLSAQSPMVRLAPDDPDQRILPEEGRIESVARIGGTTLAVWGASGNAPDRSIMLILRMQLLDGAAPVGQQRTLHGPDARPSGGVWVVPLPSAFLVIWNDYRQGAPGLYGRKVGLDGAFLGEETRLSEGAIGYSAGPRTQLVGDPARGQALVYYDYLGGVTMLRIDADGGVEESPILSPNISLQTLVYGRLPGLALVRLADHGRVIRPDGRLDRRPVYLNASAVNPSALHVGPDSSLATVTTRYLYVRGNMFDSLPTRSVRIGALDSLYDKAVAVGRTPAGDYDVYFAVVRIETNRRRITFYRVRYTTAGVIEAPVEVLTRASVSTGPVRIGWKSPVFQGVSGNSNTQLFRFAFPTQLHSGTDSAQQATTTLEFSLDALGTLKFDRSYGISSDMETNGTTGFISADPPAQPIERTSSVGASVVRVTTPAGALDLSASLGGTGIRLSRRRPTIQLSSGHLVTTWELDDMRRESARWAGVDAPTSTPVTLPVDTLAPVVPDVAVGESIVGSSITGGVASGTDDGPAIALQATRRVDTIRYRSSPDTYRLRDSIVIRRRVEVAFPEGWRRAIDLEQRGSMQDLVLSDGGWDPNRNERIINIFNGILGHATMRAIDEDGIAMWLAPRVAVTRPTVPIGTGEYLLFDDMKVVRYSGTDSVASYRITPVEYRASYRRLLGPWFLRISQFVQPNWLALERFDLSAGRIDSIGFQFPGAVADLQVIHDPRDSTLILLYIQDGLRMSRLTRDLKVIALDSLLSDPVLEMGHPDGVIRNDTLFFVWSERHAGISEVYGSWIRLEKYVPGTSAVAGDLSNNGSGAAISISSIHPNPARDRIELTWNLPASGRVRLEVIDRLGRSVMTRDLGMIDAGPRHASVELGELPAGAYLLRLGSGELHADAPVVIVR